MRDTKRPLFDSLRVAECVGGDNQLTLRNYSLSSGDPDLDSEVFYYSSVRLVAVGEGQPARNNRLTKSDVRLEII